MGSRSRSRCSTTVRRSRRKAAGDPRERASGGGLLGKAAVISVPMPSSATSTPSTGTSRRSRASRHGRRGRDRDSDRVQRRGKSTKHRSISGLSPPARAPISSRATRSAIRRPGDRGPRISQSPEGRRCFQRMSVRRTSSWARTCAGTRGWRRPATRVRSLSAARRARTPEGGHHVGGEQQMLAIGRALMASPGSSSSTSLDGHRAHPRRAYLRDDRRDQRAGHDDPARRAERETSLSREREGLCWRPSRGAVGQGIGPARQSRGPEAYLGA